MTQTMMTLVDENPSIDYLYFLYSTNCAGTENFQGMLEQLDSNILVQSLLGISSDGN